jgi:putative hemolysin
MLENKERGAKAVIKATSDRTALLGAILIGNNLANNAAASIAASLSIRIAGNNGAALAATTVLVTIVVLLFGEMIPKTIASKNPPKVAGVLAGAVLAARFVFSPATFLLNSFTGALFRLFGFENVKNTALVTEAELKTMVAVSCEEGLIRGDESKMINAVFEFDESTARDVMTPRTEISAVHEGAGYDDCMRVFREEGFSRVPVYREDLDHIVGVIHFKDFIFASGPENFSLAALMRPPMFSYEGKLTSELFVAMRSSGAHFAVVLDEYGGTSGIITLEDLIELIMGDISDEYDDDEEDEISLVSEGVYRADGSARIDEVNDRLGLNIQSDYYDTIGGFVMGRLGAVPRPGDAAEIDGTRLTVQTMNKNRIVKLTIETAPEENGSDSDEYISD